MFLDINNQHSDYNKDIWPFIKNGIIIDTSVLKIIIDGLISARISKKPSSELEGLLFFFDIIKVKDKWDKFYITPQILTEVCTHLRNDYNGHRKFSEIIKEIIPILDVMGEKVVYKNQLIRSIDYKNPIVELGDISIFIIADDFVDKKEKISILVKDRGINKRYEDNPKVMIMDYASIMTNLL